ncbi:hypothetical protein CC2G_010259 [Coprinopsis cinerea AmutBmut pab1-1]|nr:hypothetical protein CC2G_010259 [Coprinopsis cinerea AmutBmut pab1-1]KAG2013338.1 hypothetical protein CC2G_010259 [Coprinopsis cinerea AmutBmut pab1-1]
MNKPSNQQLENIFGTSKDVDVVEYILKNGREQTTTLQPDKWGNTNDSRGSLGDPSGR